VERKLIELFQSHFKEMVRIVTPLKAHGSDRKIYRLAGVTRSAIGVANADRAENIAFLEFSRHFKKVGLPVPEIYIEDLDHGVYLEEDLGDLTLFDALTRARRGPDDFPVEIEAIYKKVVRILPKFQIEGGKDLNYEVCYPRSTYDRQSMIWDLNYFKYHFLKLAGIPFNEQKLEDDFQKLADFLMEAEGPYFLYRDFQSRNILLRAGTPDPKDHSGIPYEPFFIDYQGGRRGALQYDIASLLNQARAQIPEEVRQRLLTEYLNALESYIPVDRNAFIRYYHGFVLIRMMQTLGAYGFRGLYQRKPKFLLSIPEAVRNLKHFFYTHQLPIDLPELTTVLHSIVSTLNKDKKNPSENRLTVRIFSFSYLSSGIPLDETGTGGGFVFDCRYLPNPGREAAYQQKTGRDAEVIAYLKNIPAVEEFLKHCFALVDAAVETFISRNFTSLTVCFGCTGGQHRSVYSAECLAKHLKEKYDINVELRHRELEKIG
jgi:aminoglycoside/choline kinase family phosphotransferase